MVLLVFFVTRSGIPTWPSFVVKRSTPWLSLMCMHATSSIDLCAIRFWMRASSSGNPNCGKHLFTAVSLIYSGVLAEHSEYFYRGRSRLSEFVIFGVCSLSIRHAKRRTSFHSRVYYSYWTWFLFHVTVSRLVHGKRGQCKCITFVSYGYCGRFYWDRSEDDIRVRQCTGTYVVSCTNTLHRV